MDCHTHCCHSHDTNIDPRKMIEKAIEVGFKYIAFTDHSDKDYFFTLPEYGKMEQLNVKRHIKEILALQEEFSDRIYVGLGMECSYHAKATEMYINDMALTDKWDIILNSVHTVNGKDLYFPDYYGKESKQDKYMEYLLAVNESLTTKMDYDVVAHLGYCTRRAIYGDNYMQYADFSDILDIILKKIIDRNAALELNTHARGTCANFLPHPEIIDRYIELGGTEFTFGSDAHLPERVGDKVDLVKSFLRDRGIKYCNIYKRRRVEKVKI